MTARLIAEWMSFAGWLHTAVRKDSRALALFADAEDLADEAGDGMPPQQRVPGDTWPACRAARVAQYAHQQPHWPPREPTPHSTLTTCCKPRRHTCGPAGAEWMNEYHQALAYASERA